MGLEGGASLVGAGAGGFFGPFLEVFLETETLFPFAAFDFFRAAIGEDFVAVAVVPECGIEDF